MTAVAKDVKMVIAKRSYLEMGYFKILLRKYGYCSTLDHLELITAMRLRSSASADNGEQAMVHRQLALLSQQPSLHQFENDTQYIGA